MNPQPVSLADELRKLPVYWRSREFDRACMSDERDTEFICAEQVEKLLAQHAVAASERKVLDEIHDALGEDRLSDDTELPVIIKEILETAKRRSAQLDAAEQPKLTEAVRNLYYAAVWHADRPVDEKALWTAVRDAAGFEPGHSPSPVAPPPQLSSEALGRLAADIAQDMAMEEIIRDANEVCRSAYQIAVRRGAETGWDLWIARLEKTLKIQHRFMYPESQPPVAPGEQPVKS